MPNTYDHPQTILMTAYAVHPRKGSEDGMGWRFILEAARRNRVVAITRENNRPAIEEYLAQHPVEGLTFAYFDLPKWARFWKRGSRGSSLYHWLWHAFVPAFVKKQGFQFDIAHHLNFHCDWTASFLWRLGKPTVWGPVGHHPMLPKDYLLETGGWPAYFSEWLKWQFKATLWNFDPFLAKGKVKMAAIICMNRSAAQVLQISPGQYSIMPSVGTDKIEPRPKVGANRRFTVLFMGRFVALKGVETVVRSFAQFFNQRPAAEQADLHLLMVGKGPEKDRLIDLAQSLGIAQAIEFVDWLPHDQVGAIYRSASVFFFPSHEGAGMVVAEAQAHGVPVLCYANDGPGELVNPSGSIRVPYVTHQIAIEGFALQLAVLFDNPKKRLQMAENAMEYVEQCLDWEVKGDFLQRIYRKVDSRQPDHKHEHTLINTL